MLKLYAILTNIKNILSNSAVSYSSVSLRTHQNVEFHYAITVISIHNYFTHNDDLNYTDGHEWDFMTPSSISNETIF